jgi:hypothetical protein
LVISTGYSLSEEVDSLIRQALSTTPATYHNPADVTEIERLRAQAMLKDANLRDLAEIAKDYAPWYALYCGRSVEYIIKDSEKCISKNQVEYHNPTDVRLLEKTKQALVAVFRENPTQESMEYAESVLAEIDKVVGE